ncbi:MAG: DUF4230 domain-containing protein [Planctomycetota bacterium]
MVPITDPPNDSTVPSTALLKWASLLLALVIVAATTVALYSLSVMKQAAHDATEIFQPQTKYLTILSGAIGELNHKPKLVVLSANITAMVTVESTTTFVGYNIGTAKVEVSAPARVQYVLNLKNLKLDDMYYDSIGKRMVITIPRPTLDTEMVQIESDPDKIQIRTAMGWSPVSYFKGATMRDDAVKHLRDAAIEQGRHELLQERAEKDAKESVGELLNTVKDAMKSDGVRLDVEFKKQ